MTAFGRKALPLLAAGALAAAPAPEPLPRTIKDTPSAKPGHALVLGAVKLVQDGKARKCSTLLSECILIILPSGSTRATVYAFKGDAPFAWSLPPGKYTLLAYEVAYPGTTTVPLDLAFTVPEGAGAVYIGDLLLLLRGNGYRTGLADFSDAAQQRYKAAHPEDSSPLVKSLLDIEPTPAAPAAKTTAICAAEWGLTCTDDMRGVTPTSPATIKDHAPVPDLRPQFAWQPSPVQGVTYDLALFEGVSYAGTRQSWLPGPLVAYRAGLTAPSWQPEEALRPQARYYWSVRLRKGDIVSTWSTRSHFSFFLIGFSSGSGDYFNFSTPPAAPAR